jgi:choline dehydrogenase-like flavoprotein
MWAEVKPDNGFDPIAFKKITELSKQSGFPVLLLEGSPMDKPYKVHFREDPVLYECCLTNYHDYPQEEHRFYAMPGGPSDSHWEDTRIASEFARSAQFEYGKHGN